ncbi:MAG TPA: hypothetical protein VLF69_03035 [Candidatus Saccharimonadales bacterium]|nr:hypothetical protein [Candidatus Saccharimonadales bacterium]
MNSLVILKQHPTPSSGAKDIADHLLGRMYYGKAVIVADNPKVFIGVLRKQWLRLFRVNQRERARTLNPTKKAELDGMIAYMQGLRFTTRYPLGEYPGDVYVVSLAAVLHWPPDCSTLYITTPIETRECYLVSAWMPRGGLVVIYARP